MQKESVGYCFAIFININIFKCIQIALNTLFFPIHHSCKEKKSVKQRNRIISGPIHSGSVRSGDQSQSGEYMDPIYLTAFIYKHCSYLFC